MSDSTSELGDGLLQLVRIVVALRVVRFEETNELIRNLRRGQRWLPFATLCMAR